MSPNASHRLEVLLALMPEPQFDKLAISLDCRATITALCGVILDSGTGLEETIKALDKASFSLLKELAGKIPQALSEHLPEQSLNTLIDEGLVFILQIQDFPRIYVPLEIQQWVAEHSIQDDPDLRILLSRIDNESLQCLEEIYLDDEADDIEDDGPLGRICRLADAIESAKTLKDIIDNLPTTAREILFWCSECNGPVPISTLQEIGADSSSYHGDRAALSISQLQRFGLLLPLNQEDNRRCFVVPRSIRPTVLHYLDTTLTGRSAQTYQNLIGKGHLSFPDEGPHGWGGNAMRALRELYISWLSDDLEELPACFNVAVGLQIINPEKNEPGAFSSLLLDLSGETALARQSMRIWLALADDPWTIELIKTLGGDAKTLSEYFSQATPEHSENDLDKWLGYLFIIRAQLLFTLSLLSPGKWYPIEQLANLFHLLISRSTLTAYSRDQFSELFPLSALPDHSVIISRSERLQPIQDWLERWLNEFANVLGTAQLDRSGTLFRVHPDTFCVFRDSDIWFRAVWNDLSTIVGEDIEMWMPIPNDPGARITGVARCWVTGNSRIALSSNCHLADLRRLSRWAHPVTEPSGFGFQFSEESIAGAISLGANTEEMLLWLAARFNGTVPPSIRSLFPQSSSATDTNDDRWVELAANQTVVLLNSLDNWGVAPPAELFEEIRSWGASAVRPVEELLRELLSKDNLNDPKIRHACLLLGELGANSALPLLLRVITSTSLSSLEAHAAAAACMRLGRASLTPLTQLLGAKSSDKQVRLVAAMALTGLATLHPETHEQVSKSLLDTIQASTFDSDLQTKLTLELCRVGHPNSEKLIEDLLVSNNWNSSEWSPQDALWLARISPCVWGSYLYSIPLTMLYLINDEADEFARESGVREILSTSGVNSDTILYGHPRLISEES